MKKFLHISICLCSLAKILQSQDMTFADFTSAPLAMNPSLAGDCDYGRVSTLHRLQWPAFDLGYATSYFSFDFNPLRSHSAWAVDVSSDHSNVHSNKLTGYYSYSVRASRKMTVKMGLSAGIENRKYGVSNYKFVDQYDDFGYTGQITKEQIENLEESIIFPTFSSGGFVYSENWWAGASVFNMNMPNVSVMGKKSIIPLRYSVHAGAFIPFNSELTRRMYDRAAKFVNPVSSFSPYASYTGQGPFHKVDIGFNLYLFPVSLGVNYRGLPFAKFENTYYRNQGMVYQIGLKKEYLYISYAFEQAIGSYISNTGGGHEISITYLFDHKGKVIGRGTTDLTPIPMNIFY